MKAWLPALAAVVALGGGSEGGADAATAASGAVDGASRILYASNWSGRMEIYAVDPSRPSAIGQVTFGGDGFVETFPSPNGRNLASIGGSDALWDNPGDLWVSRANGTAPRRIAKGVGSVSWSADSRQLAYDGAGGLHIVSADGSGDRPATSSTPRWVRQPGDSPNGEWRATPVYRNSRIVALAVTSSSGGTRYSFEAASAAAWSPDSKRLAFTHASGIHVAEVRTGRVRRLTRANGFGLTWSPDGRSLAFIEGIHGWTESTVWTSAPGDLMVVTLSGRVRKVVDADRADGGRIVSVAWTKPPAGVRYRQPEPTPRTRIMPMSLLAGGSISRLAADGQRVAFVSCEGVFAWTPATGEVTTLRPTEPLSSCRARDRLRVGYNLALAGDRLAYGELQGCHTINVTLRLEVLAPTRGSSPLANGRGSCGYVYTPGVGFLAGSDDLLVYSTWDERCGGTGCTPVVTVRQDVNRVESGGCPCPVIASSPGLLIPADVENGRIVVFGENDTLVLDRDGRQLLSLGVAPRAAQLSGGDVVVLVRGELRSYDLASGALRHAWPLPDVPSGTRCEPRCVPTGVAPGLILEDVARGLVTYVFDGQVHLLRLADGADAGVARGALARFMDAGLVYADGSRLRLVPFDRLPLR